MQNNTYIIRKKHLWYFIKVFRKSFWSELENVVVTVIATCSIMHRLNSPGAPDITDDCEFVTFLE